MKKLNLILIGILFLFVCACQPEDAVEPADARDKLIGTYNCEETEAGTLVTTFDIVIRKSTSTTNTTEVLIDNFYNLNNQHTVSATIINNTIKIKQQNVNQFSLSGDGTFNGSNKISLSYRVQPPSDTARNCTAIATKR